MQRKSNLAWLSFAAGLALAAALAGCSSPAPTEKVVRPHEDLVLRVACPGAPLTAVVTAYGRGWAARAGARVDVVVYDPLKGPESAPGTDAWIVAAAEMPRSAAAGQLLAVPESLLERGAAYSWDNLLPIYRDKLLKWDNIPYALPILGEAPLCFYRSDWFDDARHQAAFDKKYGRKLTAPATWEEFADLAVYFQQQKETAPTAPSLPPLPEEDDALDREFHAVAAPFARRAIREDEEPPAEAELFSYHYDTTTGRPRVDTPGFVHALKLLQRLQACRPAGNARDAPDAFRKGQAALCLADATWIPRFQSNAAIKDKFRACRLPGSTAYFAYQTGEIRSVKGENFIPYLGAASWLGVVPKSSANPAAAFALLADLSGPQTSRQIVIEPAWGGGAFRREHLENPAGWYSFRLDQGQTTGLLESLRQTLQHPGIRNPVLRLRIPDQREHQRVLLAEIRTALFTGGDAGKALNAVVRRWQELDQSRTEKTRRAEYLLSLSLKPD